MPPVVLFRVMCRGSRPAMQRGVETGDVALLRVYAQDDGGLVDGLDALHRFPPFGLSGFEGAAPLASRAV